jgi:hypothetical protein
MGVEEDGSDDHERIDAVLSVGCLSCPASASVLNRADGHKSFT